MLMRTVLLLGSLAMPAHAHLAVDKPSPPATIEQQRGVPAGGKLLLFIGQDSDTIDAYQAQVPEDALEGITLYTTLKSNHPADALPAVFSRANWGAGDVDFNHSLARAPGAALAIGLALDACKQADHAARIAAGDYDASLDRLVGYLKSLAPRQVFLRIGYEFDGPWNCYEPSSYRAAFRHVASALKQRQASNVMTVWQTAAWPDPGIAGARSKLYDLRRKKHFERWYPGDDAVDWVGVSVFYRDLSQWAYVPPDRPEAAQERALAFARSRGKPVMIAESAPQGLRTGGLTRSPIQRNEATGITAQAAWTWWYEPFFDFVDKNRDVIRAVAYINTHWEAQPMWRCKEGVQAGRPGCDNGNWGDSRIQANAYIRARWLEQVTDASKWVQAEE